VLHLTDEVAPEGEGERGDGGRRGRKAQDPAEQVAEQRRRHEVPDPEPDEALFDRQQAGRQPVRRIQDAGLALRQEREAGKQVWGPEQQVGPGQGGVQRGEDREEHRAGVRLVKHQTALEGVTEE
jgi:hypothetical protein